MRSFLSLLFLSACAPTPCADGFGRTADGMCSPIDDGSSPDDTNVDTQGETGEIARRSIFDPGAFEDFNVLVLSVDTLTLEAALNPDIAAPLVAIADEGVLLLRHACGAAWTSPCMSSFALGVPAVEAGDRVFVPSESSPNAVMAEDEILVAEVFADAGYSTYLKTENAFYGQNSNSDQGFDLIEDGKNGTPASVVEFSETLSGLPTPFFAHLHVIGPHAGYYVPEAGDEYYAACDFSSLPEGISMGSELVTFDVADAWNDWTEDVQQNVMAQMRCAYNGKAQWQLDLVFGILWRELENRGLLDDTLVVITGDHGEEFALHFNPVTGAPIIGHNVSVYGDVVNQVGVFWAKDIESGTWNGVTDHGDLAPTLLRATGISIPEAMTGIPIGDAPETRIGTHYKCGGNRGEQALASYAATMGQVRVHRREDESWEMFDLATDPEELDPLDESVPSEMVDAIEAVRSRAESEGWCGPHARAVPEEGTHEHAEY